MLGFFVGRMMVLLCSKDRNNYVYKIKIEEREEEEWNNFRNHNITLASFTIVAIAVIVAFPSQQLQKNIDALFYLSLAMFAFFTASYLLNFRINRWGPYIANCLETVGVIGVGFGLLGLIQNVIQDEAVWLVYAVFAFGILAIAAIETTFNIRSFHQKKGNVGSGGQSNTAGGSQG